MSTRESEKKGEVESRKVAEASRQTEWTSPSFLKELFLGNFQFDLIHPYPEENRERPEFAEFYRKLQTLLREKVDAAMIDTTGEYPPEIVEELKRMGAFGMKIPKEYGGLEFSQVEYNQAMELLGSVDGNLVALLSAHQSIGVPQPLKIFGTPEQKQKYLPQCAAGAISAFALTEAQVGSDPASLSTTIERTEDGRAFILNGEKLWCTNGTLAELLVVMARDPSTNKISAFVVETKWEGVKVEYRSRFMGLRALSNAVISFTDVRVPVENLIGKEGRGLKIALVTLNTGRLTIPAAAVGTAKLCVEICRRWSKDRVQWGLPIGKHEAIAQKLADMAATTYAMECVTDLSSRLADRGGYDIRLEAASAKEWVTGVGWKIVDETMQIRGGRGYETENSLFGRGEAPIPVERMMRDFRINRIFEGSSEIMHLFMAREAVDKHLQVAGALVEGRTSPADKMKALPKIAGFYALWYPSRWFGWGRWPRYAEFGSLASHLRFVDRRCRKLAREVFHGMMVFGPKMAKKQAFLFRAVDIANELFAMAATVSHAQQLKRAGRAEAPRAFELAELFCRSSRRRVRGYFKEFWRNDDAYKYKVAQDVLQGNHAWLESGIQELGMEDGDMVPSSITEPKPVETGQEETSPVA